MTTSRRNRLTKALMPAVALPAVVVGGADTSAAVPGAPSAATAVERTDTAAGAAHHRPCPTTTDWRRVAQSRLEDQLGDEFIGAVVELWYSPTTRCTFGQIVSQYATPCQAPGNPAHPYCGWAEMGVADDGILIARTRCEITTGEYSCKTAPVYDGSHIAATDGFFRTSRRTARGKTAWY